MADRRGAGAPRSQASDLRRTVRLFRRFRGSPRVYVVGVVLLVLEAATAVVEPYPISYLIDVLQGARPVLAGAPDLLGSARNDTVLVLTAAIIVIAAVNSAADSFTEVCMARGGRSLGYNLRVAMYSHLQRLPLGYHDTKRTGDVLTRVTGDVLVLEDFVVKSLSNILGSLLVLVGSFVFLLMQSWSVALVALVVIPFLALASNHYSKRIKVAAKTQRDREGDLASTAQEMLSSIRLVQSHGRGTVDLEKFSRQTGQSMLASLRAANIQAEFSFVIALIEAVAIVDVVWLGLWLVDHGVVTVGMLVLFILLLQNMFKPARKIVSEWYKIGNVFASVERLEDLLRREVSVTDAPDAVPAPPLTGRLSLRHVSFSYPAEQADGSTAVRPPVLRDVDFDLAPGEVVALVGASGAGKSTIAQLVPRLYDPDSGAVLVDDMDVRSVTLSSLRRQVSLVLQETVLLSGTVAENIAYGVDGADQRDIEAAARMANAHDFITALPEGYGTVLGERGSTLSGGQRQRIAIARAFMRRAPILILDEPTTGLDAESARTVVDALRHLMRDTTTLVVSHDEALVRCADRVLTVADGRLLETDGSAGGQSPTPTRPGRALVPATADPAPGEDAPPGDPSLGDAPLGEGLASRLPALPTALDEQEMAQRVDDLLVAPGHRVRSVSAGSFWIREDGSCSLRYTVRLADPAGTESEHVLLARLHEDESRARDYLDGEVRPLLRVGAPGDGPWAQQAAVLPGSPLTLHAFPCDPDLPTLRQALYPRTVAKLVQSPPTAEPPTVEVVHHPRSGACVLRYRVAGPDGDPDQERLLYGKVYPDGRRGAVVDGFLRELGRTAGDGAGTFPRPARYAPGLRLLVTEALEGAPAIPALLTSVLRGASTDEAGPDTAALHASLRAAGAALAALHDTDVAGAPVRTGAAEQAALCHELELVARTWPDTARRVRSSSIALQGNPPVADELVLSHGDFTPSQVLVDGANAAVVDLDTLCWSDPALDLGRFTAHLELLAVKRGGDAGRALAADLVDAFLEAYAGGGPRAASAAVATDRIAFYRSATLTRTALRACRQLKDARAALALSLLDPDPTRRTER